MNCADVRELLNDRLDQEIDAERVRAIEAHLSDCTSCDAEAHALASIKSIVQSRLYRPAAPPDLRLRVARAAQPHGRSRAFTRRWRAVAAILLVAGVMTIYSRISGPGSSPSLAHAEMVRVSESVHVSYCNESKQGGWLCETRLDAQRILREQLGIDFCLPLQDSARLQYKRLELITVCNRSGVSVSCLFDDKPLTVIVVPGSRCAEMPKSCQALCYCVDLKAGKQHVMVCFQRSGAYMSVVSSSLSQPKEIEDHILKLGAD
ncbi:MAG: anti-sigma factor family protein [Planctomycetota bacterium]